MCLYTIFNYTFSVFMHIIKCARCKRHCQYLGEEGIGHGINKGTGLAHLLLFPPKPLPCWPSPVCLSLVPEISPT